MLLYNCFRSSENMDQMFLTVRGAVQGLFKSTLGAASVFDHVVLRPGRGSWRVPHLVFFFFGVNLDYVILPVASSTSVMCELPEQSEHIRLFSQRY